MDRYVYICVYIYVYIYIYKESRPHGAGELRPVVTIGGASARTTRPQQPLHCPHPLLATTVTPCPQPAPNSRLLLVCMHAHQSIDTQRGRTRKTHPHVACFFLWSGLLVQSFDVALALVQIPRHSITPSLHHSITRSLDHSSTTSFSKEEYRSTV